MLPVQLGIGATTQQTCLLSSVCNHGCLEHLLCWLQYCGAEQQNSQDAGTGAVVKCLVANNQSLTTSCLGEVQRLAASALLLYQPVSHPSVPKPIEDTFKGQLRNHACRFVMGSFVSSVSSAAMLAGTCGPLQYAFSVLNS